MDLCQSVVKIDFDARFKIRSSSHLRKNEALRLMEIGLEEGKKDCGWEDTIFRAGSPLSSIGSTRSRNHLQE